MTFNSVGASLRSLWPEPAFRKGSGRCIGPGLLETRENAAIGEEATMTVLIFYTTEEGHSQSIWRMPELWHAGSDDRSGIKMVFPADAPCLLR